MGLPFVMPWGVDFPLTVWVFSCHRKGPPTKGKDMMLTENSWTKLTVHAFEQSGKPIHVTFFRRFKTEEAARAFADQFPKSYKFRVRPTGGRDGIAYWGVDATTYLYAVKGNEKNETGIKRYHAIMAKAEKLGIETIFDAGRMLNAYTDRETFEAAIAI